MASSDDLIRTARQSVGTEKRPPPQAAPAKRVAVISCMDARVDPSAALGLELGDAHIIRNAGGLATDDALRSLALSQGVAGTREVKVLMHTDCAVSGLDELALGKELEAKTGSVPPMALGSFDGLEERLAESVERIRSSGFLPEREAVSGYIYQTETGRTVGPIA